VNKNFCVYILTISVVTGLHAINGNFRDNAEKVRRTVQQGASKSLNDYSTWLPTGIYLSTRTINGGIGRRILIPTLVLTGASFLANALKYSFPQNHAKLKKQAPLYLAPIIECPATIAVLMHSLVRLAKPNNFSRIPYVAAASLGVSGAYYYNENPQSRFIRA